MSKKVKQISDETARHIVSSVNKLCEYVDEGKSATEAAIKVAQDRGLSPGHVELVCRSYNTGAVNAARKNGDTFTDKFAAQDLAVADSVLDAVYPGEAKTAAEVNPVADIYLPQKTGKVAKAKIAPRYRLSKRVTDKCDSKDESCDSGKTRVAKAKEHTDKIAALRSELQRARREAVRKVAAVKDAYRDHYRGDNGSLAWLRHSCDENFGKTAGIIIDHLANSVLGPVGLDAYEAEFDEQEKTAAKRISRFVSHPEPFTLSNPVIAAVKEAVQATEEYAQKENAFPRQVFDIRKEAQWILDEEKLTPQLLPPRKTAKDTYDQLWEKRASMMAGAIGGSTASLMKKVMEGGGGLTPDSMLSARVQLNDPGHSEELRRVRAETMLNRLIASDDVIASYSPEDIALAYDEINESSPAITNNLSLLRANLRRQLQGNLTPLEADSMVAAGDKVQGPLLPRPIGSEASTGKKE